MLRQAVPHRTLRHESFICLSIWEMQVFWDRFLFISVLLKGLGIGPLSMDGFACPMNATRSIPSRTSPPNIFQLALLRRCGKKNNGGCEIRIEHTTLQKPGCLVYDSPACSTRKRDMVSTIIPLSPKGVYTPHKVAWKPGKPGGMNKGCVLRPLEFKIGYSHGIVTFLFQCPRPRTKPGKIRALSRISPPTNICYRFPLGPPGVYVSRGTTAQTGDVFAERHPPPLGSSWLPGNHAPPPKTMHVATEPLFLCVVCRCCFFCSAGGSDLMFRVKKKRAISPVATWNTPNLRGWGWCKRESSIDHSFNPPGMEVLRDPLRRSIPAIPPS